MTDGLFDGLVHGTAGGTAGSDLPPLVSPGPALSTVEAQRYSRHLLIPEVGSVGQRRLNNARVLVLGAGGLGSPALLYLAAAGVGTIGIVDFDVVETSNLQRQIIHTDGDVGRPKAESAARAVAAVNPLVHTVLHPVQLSSANALDIFSGYDVVLDGTDNFATRYLVNDACVLLGKPYVWGSIFRFEGQVSVFWAGRGPQYRDVYPVPPPAGSVPSCAEGGVLGVLCATVGSVMATEAVKLICGIGQSLLGRMLVYNALDMTFRTVRLRPDPSAPEVTGLIDYDEFCGARPAGEQSITDATISPRELETLRAERDDVLLVDVREPPEHDLVAIPGDVLIPKGRILSGEALDELPHDRLIVLYCKSGARSADCLRALHAAGYDDALHLGGGVMAWAQDIAPMLPRY
ncbi:MAG: adenylyltransferase/sulfurtransferase MoeZ [Actinobacteria bacterium 69-20]|nr:molybdopterin-synthase adenylyltransferase MoeB [Actinomycetota bacterium]OJV30231.1 MAG: adenylyltransferase/sulfurtransferase MoeZ [Actinobacteria bacterium 69-20]